MAKNYNRDYEQEKNDAVKKANALRKVVGGVLSADDERAIAPTIQVAAYLFNCTSWTPFRCACKLPEKYGDFYVWCPNCVGTRKGWKNEFSEKNTVLRMSRYDENGKLDSVSISEQIAEHSKDARRRMVVFARFDKRGYRFMGVYKFDAMASAGEGICVWNRDSKEFRIK